jgi:hypothetical protein
MLISKGVENSFHVEFGKKRLGYIYDKRRSLAITPVTYSSSSPGGTLLETPVIELSLFS